MPTAHPTIAASNDVLPVTRLRPSVDTPRLIARCTSSTHSKGRTKSLAALLKFMPRSEPLQDLHDLSWAELGQRTPMESYRIVLYWCQIAARMLNIKPPKARRGTGNYRPGLHQEPNKALLTRATNWRVSILWERPSQLGKGQSIRYRALVTLHLTSENWPNI